MKCIFIFTMCIFVVSFLLLRKIQQLEYRSKFEQIIADIASRFVHIEYLEETINVSLKQLGEFSDVSRAYIFLFTKDLEYMHNTHEWCSEETSSQLKYLKQLSCKQYAWWVDKLKKREIIHIRDIYKMPEEASNEKKILEQQNILSVIAFPLDIDGILSGFVGFDYVRHIKKWEKDDIKLLGVFAQILGAALKRREVEHMLREKEGMINVLFEKMLNPIFLVNEQGKYLEANQTGLDFLECSKEELVTKNIWDFCPQTFVEANQQKYQTIPPAETIEVESQVNGKIKNLILNIVPVKVGDKYNIWGIGQDITYLKKLEYDLKKSKQYYQSLFDYTLDGVFSIDLNGIIFDMNKRAQAITGYSPQNIIGKHFKTIYTLESAAIEIEYFKKSKQGQCYYGERTVIHKEGSKVEVSVMAVPIIMENKINGVYAILRDITKTKRIQEKLEHMSFHDALTNLYNRMYIEKEIENIEKQESMCVAVAMCDINGLKLINDTFGHKVGDEMLVRAANIIKNTFDIDAIVARIGGDEIQVLVKNVDEAYMENICHNIKNVIERYNAQNPKLPLSMSIGYAVGNTAYQSLSEILVEADNHMYRKKFQCTNSARSDLVHALMKTLEEKDLVTKEHVNRLQKLILGISKQLKLPEQQWKDLSLLAQFHDIGKIGISNHILKKPGSLKEHEYQEMKRHAEIGFRIINAVPNLSEIAQLILKHHEWWNGKGYPLGLKGEEIPLECRIFTILDTYDVITNERPYKKAMSHQEAIDEIRRCTGTQFDPHLAPILITILDQKYMENVAK